MTGNDWRVFQHWNRQFPKTALQEIRALSVYAPRIREFAQPGPGWTVIASTVGGDDEVDAARRSHSGLDSYVAPGAVIQLRRISVRRKIRRTPVPRQMRVVWFVDTVSVAALLKIPHDRVRQFMRQSGLLPADLELHGHAMWDKIKVLQRQSRWRHLKA